jgi:hypothetical protein
MDMKRLSHIIRQASGQLASGWAIIVANAAKRSAHVAYRIFIVALSAGVALSLPPLADLSARNFPFDWSLIEDEKVFLRSRSEMANAAHGVEAGRDGKMGTGQQPLPRGGA